MKEVKSLKSAIVFFVGLSFLMIMILLYWSSTHKLRRLDKNYTGKPIAISISLKLNDIKIYKDSNKRRTKTLYRGYLHCLGNFCATVLNIFSKEIISNSTKYKSNMKHLKELVKQN